MSPMPARPKKRHVILTVLLLAFVVSALALLRYTESGRAPLRSVETIFWKARFWAFPLSDDPDRLAGLHANAQRESRAQCVACHEDKTNSHLVLHRIHLRSDLLQRLECHDCHRRIDLNKRGNTAVVTWVDVGFCKQCHSPFPGLEAGSPMRPADFESDCTTCHKGEDAPKHDKPYLPDAIPASECKGCHGARVLPSTARHERSDWLSAHGSEALFVGADTCYRCHDFGLKFCDRCHSKKPPTHLPAERWRAIHADEARADTRVCYSCHKVSYCKRCHLNHEAGWIKRHPAFVKQEGTSSCKECHSESACSYCHQLNSVTEEASATP